MGECSDNKVQISSDQGQTHIQSFINKRCKRAPPSTSYCQAMRCPAQEQQARKGRQAMGGTCRGTGSPAPGARGWAKDRGIGHLGAPGGSCSAQPGGGVETLSHKPRLQQPSGAKGGCLEEPQLKQALAKAWLLCC